MFANNIDETSINASVRNLDLSRLNITNKWKDTKFNFDINTNVTYNSSNANLVDGNLTVRDFSMISPNETFSINRLNINADKESISMQSDFGNIDIHGNIK